MMVTKKIFGFFLALTVFLFCAQSSFSQSEPAFVSDYNIDITINNQSFAQVHQQITVTNQTIDYYLKNYVVSLGFREITNIRITDQDGVSVTYQKEVKEDNTLLTLTPNRGVVGVGSKNVFNIYFSSYEAASKKGLMWEVIIPGVEPSPNLGSYNIYLNVPQNFGPPTREPYETDNNYYTFLFTKKDLTNKGQLINFGKHQIYDFTISYALKNSYILSNEFSVTLPPTIPNVQQVFFESISPAPTSLYEDNDGNQYAKFKIPGGKQLKPTIKGKIIVFNNINTLSLIPTEIKDDYTKEDEFLPVNNPEIKKIASGFENADEIYKFVLEKLEYKKVFPKDELIRIGALSALESGKGVCTEFSDLLVTLLRAKGIPAQSLAGFAYTSEEELSTDPEDDRVVLHSWVRWLNDDESWQYTDPTWGASTGLDYFNKFDTNHVVFTIHGSNSTLPYSAGAYVEGSETLKDKVDIAFSESEFESEDFTTFEQLKSDYDLKQTTQKDLLQKISVFFVLIIGVCLIAGALWVLKKSTR